MVSNGISPNDHWWATLVSALPWVLLIALSLLTIYALVQLLVSLEHRRQLKSGNFTLIELIPPRIINKTTFATSNLLSVIHVLVSPHSLGERLLRRNGIISLEIVSTKAGGIRYMVYVPKRDALTIKRDIVAYLPGVSCKITKNYNVPPKASATKVVAFHQTGHISLPLNSQNDLNQHDPVSYMTGAMTQLKTNELIAFQMLLSPIDNSWFHRAGTRFVKGQTISKQRITTSLARFVTGLIKLCLNTAKRLVTIFRVMVLDSPGHSRKVDVSTYFNPDSKKDELQAAIQEKLSQPLFKVNIRALVVASDKKLVKQRIRALEASLASFDNGLHQSLRVKHNLNILRHYYLSNMLERLPSLLPKSAPVLSANEVAAVYHFPYGSASQPENLLANLSRSLPAPVSLKTSKKLDVLLGVNNHNGVRTPIGLTAAERERHVYIVGGTGNGKTTMLAYGIEQDIRSGHGLAVIDPHGDLAESILKYIPKKRLSDVIYFNPDDVAYPIGLNLLELPEGLSGDELIREKDLITETVVSVFRKIFSEDDSGGHRIEYILRNTIQTALTMENPTIFTIFRLLTSSKYRREAVASLDDEDLKDFWTNEMGKAGEFQRVKMSAGITSKVGRFLFSGSAKRILGQPKSTIDFDDIINSGKVLICNFSKGLLGEDTSALFGITVLAKLQIATLRRARLEPDKRQPFYLYVDEFQNFATMSFVQMMSEARKYKLFLNMAEQSTSQQADQRIINIILANVGTVICFRSANPTDEQTLLPVFTPFVEAGELAYLPPYHFYIRIASTKPEAPFSGETVLINNSGITSRIQQVTQASRLNYALSTDSPDLLLESPVDIDDYEIDSPLAIP